MRPILAALALAAMALAAPGARAQQLEEFLRICSAPDSPPDRALRFCRMALERGGLDRRQRALVLFNAGVAAFNLGRYAETVETQTEAIAIAPAFDEALVSRAQAHERLGNIPEALADYDAAIRASPDAAGPYLARGTLFVREGRHDAAVVDLTRAIDLQPDWTDAHFERGRALFALGRAAEAERDFSAVIARNPRDPAAWVNRGEARAAQGSDRALNDFDRAVMLAGEWGGAFYARGRHLERQGEREAAGADYLRAFQLGHTAPDLLDKVRGLSGG